jgi:hypothetical protein
VDEGQYLARAPTIVTLQSLDPIVIDFYVPQQSIATLNRIVVQASIDTYPGTRFTGTFLGQLQGRYGQQERAGSRHVPTMPIRRLVPGMYATVAIDDGRRSIGYRAAGGDQNFTDIFIRRPVLATRRQPDDPGARPARAIIGSLQVLQYPQTENGIVTVDDLLRRRPGRDRRLHHHAARKRHRPGQRHRLHDLDQPERHQHDHRQPAAELRCRQGADRDQHQGQLGAQPAADRLAAAALTVKVGQTIDAMYIGFSSDVLPPTRSPTI